MNKITSPSLIILFVVLIITIGQITTDIYLPSLPDMTVLFNVDADLMQLSLTVYLATFGISQLFYGPLSDHFGRRNLLLLGISIYIVATLACALANNVTTLLLARAVQGAGIGCGAVVARAITRDVFTGVQLARTTAYISLAMALSPAIAPAIGGAMHVAFGWQSNFILLIIYTCVLFIAFYTFLPETLIERNRKDKFILESFKDYWHILSFPSFLAYGICIMINFGSFMAYQTVAPFLLQNNLGLNAAQSGRTILFVALGYGVGTFLNNKFVQRFGIKKLMIAGMCVSLVSAAAMFWISLTGYLSVAGIVAPMAFYTVGSGLFNPGAMANMLTPFPRAAATASACMGATITVGAGILTLIIAPFGDSSQLPLASLLLLTISLSAIILFFYILPRENAAV